MKRKRRTGFTLIEIILAIALLGIIAVGMVPVLTSVTRLTVKTKDITLNSFDAQGSFEKVIQKLRVELAKPLIDFNRIEGQFDGVNYESFSIFGKSDVKLYDFSQIYPLNNSKRLSVSLSESLAEKERVQLLSTDGVSIQVSTDTTNTVADVSLTPKPVLTGIYNTSSDPSFYTNIYTWYASLRGNQDPKFPDDYERIYFGGITPSSMTANLASFIDRYIVFTVIPVDIHGVRGNEAVSTNRVYVLGNEWRAGLFAWVDKNNDTSYSTSNDVPIPQQKLIEPFDSHISFLDPENLTVTIDPSNGSLYVPMGTEPLSISESGQAKWDVDKGINLARDIVVNNNSNIELTARDGDIILYQSIQTPYVSGSPVLIADGPNLRTLNGNILLFTEGRGSLYLQNYSRLQAQNAQLIAHGPVNIRGSQILANNGITIDTKQDLSIIGNRDIGIYNSQLSVGNLAGGMVSINSRNGILLDSSTVSGSSAQTGIIEMYSTDDIELTKTTFSNINTILHNDVFMTGGGWTSGNILTVADNKTITFKAGTSKINNSGNLSLGDTGRALFTNSMVGDLMNPLLITLTGSDNTIKISTNYGRNVGYADSKLNDTIAVAGKYQNLGNNKINLEYTTDMTSATAGLAKLNFSFDGTDTISISADALGPVNREILLTIRDKYASNEVFKTIKFTVALAAGPADVTVNEEISTTQITAIGAITGLAKVGQTVAAGTLTPSNALATYQWQISSSASGPFSNVSGATSDTYTILTSDEGKYLRVQATGTGVFTGTVISNVTPQINALISPITAIDPIIGIAQVGQTLTAGELTPTGATATYQWQYATTSSGTYSNITGATANTFTVRSSDENRYLRVVAYGTGAFTGNAVSAPTTRVIPRTLITGIDDIIGTAQVGQTLTAGQVRPSGATVTYQWERRPSWNSSNYSNISGATGSTYAIGSGDFGYYIRVTVTGIGGFYGTETSDRTSAVAGIAITGIEAISGIAQVGQTLSAGELTPPGATATYQWQYRTSSSSNWYDISGATGTTYTLRTSDINDYIRVEAIGTGGYTGTVRSASTAQVTAGTITAIDPISGTVDLGQTLTAGALTPSGASANYQWQSSVSSNSGFTNISGATTSTYVIRTSDMGRYIRVVATGTNGYTGTVNSSPTSLVPTKTLITGIGNITRSGSVLTAGPVSPSGATVIYQWQRYNWSQGTWYDLSGATSNTYTPGSSGYYRVVVTGTGSYYGTATSNNYNYNYN